jgi:hypothetical protein
MSAAGKQSGDATVKRAKSICNDLRLFTNILLQKSCLQGQFIVWQFQGDRRISSDASSRVLPRNFVIKHVLKCITL